MMEKIRLVVFNEEYWGKGLIYSQNILPLLSLKRNNNVCIEVISFTSIPILIMKWKTIRESIRRLNNMGVYVWNFPVLYFPTRLLLPRWFLLPYFYINVFAYVLFLRLLDYNKNVVYNLRSYQPALAFYAFYGNRNKLVFDPRTDFIEENINAGNFKKDGFTVKLWKKLEGKFVNKFRRTIVISDPFKENIIKTHKVDPSKISVLYNPIDYAHFKRNKISHDGYNFLYTGSLVGWNNLENYLYVYGIFYRRHKNSRFIVCTSASVDKIEAILHKPEYKDFVGTVEVHYNVPYEKLPDIYSLCDFGFQIMNKKDSRVGVKFIEYIAAGVIPIINKNVMGAAVLAKSYDMGVILDDGDTEDDICNKIINAKQIITESDTYKKFKAQTDTANVADRIENIYLDEIL